MADEDTSQASEPVAEPVEPATAVESEEQTAQIPANEPLPSVPEPLSPTPAPAPATIVHAARDLLVKARATIQFRKTAKLEKILAALQKKNHITNDEVEKLLHVSDATATRYLSQLEKEGKIKQIGKTGKAVTYTKP